MASHVFVECRLATGETTGGKVTFNADDPAEAAIHALYFARLTNPAAKVGPTGLIVYPDGKEGERAWVHAPPPASPPLLS